MPKSGGEHLASLRDGRSIYIDGARVEDPTSCRAFRNVASSVKRLYDFANSPANRDLMTFETETGRPANRIWQLPATYADLIERRKALEAWTALHAGFLGRAAGRMTCARWAQRFAAASSRLCDVIARRCLSIPDCSPSGLLRPYSRYGPANGSPGKATFLASI